MLIFGTRVPIKTSSSNLYRYNGKEEQQPHGFIDNMSIKDDRLSVEGPTTEKTVIFN